MTNVLKKMDYFLIYKLKNVKIYVSKEQNTNLKQSNVKVFVKKEQNITSIQNSV